ncbi:MAG: ATP-binding protein [Candidatus Poribacteria bacterium]|nr:MAG: ATP-binding protein [Candidatus Poribacteria bacterium]
MPILWPLLLTAVAGEVGERRPSPFAVVHPVGVSEVRWTEGFWAQRFAVCRDRSIPAMWEIMRGDRYKPYYLHFLIAAGERSGDYRGAPWNDGDFYKFLEGVCAVLALTDDPQLKQILHRSIEAIGKAQRQDGYLHTPVLIRQRNGDRSAQPFQNRHHFEMYNMGHLLTAASLHHRATGSEAFLSIAVRTADFLERALQGAMFDPARHAVCPSHYMGLVELYRETGELRYLELARRLFEIRACAGGGDDDNQDRIPFYDQQEPVGHAVRANYLYAGAADLFLETGEERLWKPLEAIWNNLVQKKLYITGACGALYDGASPYGSPEQSSIARVHQAYGHNYQLPNTTAHGETCAAVGSLLWNWRMFLATGEARYVDLIERTLYNAVLAGVSLEGTEYFYVNPLRNVAPLPLNLRWSRRRVPYVTSYCCPPNVLRTIAQVHRYAYARSDGAIWLNLYGGNVLSTTLDGRPLELTQATNYPWEGRIRVTVKRCPDGPFALRLRVPGWAESATIRLNGRPVELDAKPGTYAEIRRRWRVGDTLQLDLPMPARLFESHPYVEETYNQVAVQRGPLVYCLESPDLPEGVRVDEVVIPADAELTPQHEPELLGGVTVIYATARALPSRRWDDALYRPLSHEPLRPLSVRMIPYYAWANRGDSEMSVWLRLCRA